MKQVILNQALVIAAALFWLGLMLIPVSSEASPEACDWAQTDPDLDASDPEVTASNPIFTHKNTNYPSEIRGLAQVDPSISGPPYRICRRYEFTNTGSSTIKELRWPDVGIGHISEVDPGDSFRRPRHLMHNTTELRPDATDLFAWENDVASGVTVFPVNVKSQKGAALTPEAGKMYAVQAKKYADALNEIKPAGMVLEASYSFFKPSEAVRLPTLQSGFSSKLVTITITSWAEVSPGDGVVRSHVEINHDWKREGSGTIFAPGIASLERLHYTSGSNVFETVGAFSKLAQFTKAIPVMPASMTKFDISYKLANESSDPILYIVEQPVTILIGGWSACIVASVYSPVPVSLEIGVHCEGSN